VTKKSGLASGDTAAVDLTGRIVQFEDDGDAVLGLVLSPKKEKFVVVTLRGRELELARNRLHVLPGAPVTRFGTSKERIQFLNDLNDRVQTTLGTVNALDIWEAVVEEPRVYSVDELTDLYFGKNDQFEHLLVRTALIAERVYFKRDKAGFEPRDRVTIENLQKAETVRLERQRAREQALDVLRKRLENREEPLPDSIHEALNSLLNLAAAVPHLDPGQQREAKEFFQLCSEGLSIHTEGTLEDRALQLLERVGIIDQNTSLPLIRYSIPQRFSNELLTEAEELGCRVPTIPIGVEDCTDLECFTVDDESTKDMDDALSLRQTVDGFEIGIHITDVAYRVPFGSLIDSECRLRTTSLYCADRTINMIPARLSEGCLSLVAGTERQCLSCFVSVGANLEVQSSRVARTRIRVGRRLSYNLVDELLDGGDPVLSKLAEIASAHEHWRVKRGASRITKREVVPFLNTDGSIRLLEIDEASPARQLVSELMILMNRVVAEFAGTHRIPMIFRGQEKWDEEEPSVTGRDPEPVAKDIAQRFKMKKSTMDLKPLPHAGLGLDAYLQVTSPIRRYVDLLHERQLNEYLSAGRPLFSEAQLAELMSEIEPRLQAATSASRETKRFWLMRYLEGRKRGVPIEGRVVRTDTRSPLVELDEVFMTVFVRSDRPLKTGDVVSIRLGAIDARRDFIRAEVS
jgi:exoribonuclease II